MNTGPVFLAAAAAAALLAGVPAASAASSASAPVVVSDRSASPLAACTADDAASQPGIDFTNAEVEPYVAVNPTNPQNVVAVWQQDRWRNGGSRGNVIASSFDGGLRWTTVTATKSSACTGGTSANGGDLPRASDPWLSFAPNGDLYLATLAARASSLRQPGSDGIAETALLVSKSTDGGLTWSDPATLIREGCSALNDKESITADPANPGFAYVVWSRYAFPTGTANASCTGARNAEISSDAVGAASFTAPVWFTRTTDGGVTWQPAHAIYPVHQGVGTSENQIVVLPHSGELLDFFVRITADKNAAGQRGAALALIRSTDRGATWSDAQIIGPIDSVGYHDPFTGAPIRNGDNLAVAIDPRTGTLYAAWEDGRFSGGDNGDIALTMSTDGGLTWATPVKANRTPASLDPGNRQAFVPALAVGADGSVAVSYYDLRFNGTDNSASDPLETDRFVAHCTSPSMSEPDLCAGDWAETRLTPTSFDLRAAPNVRGGLFLGDYEGLASLQTGFGALFTESADAADPASIYFATVH